MVVASYFMILVMAVHQGRRRRWLYLGQYTSQDELLLQDIFFNMCTYILYLRHEEGTILITPHMSLPICIITADELLKHLKLYNIRCVTVNGQMIIYVGAN